MKAGVRRTTVGPRGTKGPARSWGGSPFWGLALAAAAASAWAQQAPDLALLGPDCPRVFFFRSAEAGPYRKGMTYEPWADEYGRLMGIMGKCLDEEVVGREALNPEWFSRFKREHPRQAVLLHVNGNARDPRYATAPYFAGHWIYRAATAVVADVPAEAGETEIRVADASDFKVGTGRYRASADDLALFGIASDGRHDWTRCEQVQLVSVDEQANTIRVRRGCYGTRPLAFRAGQARAAAHMTEGPWGKDNHLLWYYNFAEHCPRDAEGKQCADRLVDELGAWFGKGGKLEAFDGLEFDVMFNETRGDTDGDGVEDNGVVGGVNRYGIGMAAFARRLRERLGPGRIIQGDGSLGPGGVRSQRAFGVLNGIESEGWPNLDDWAFDDWSGGLNRLAFWQANAQAPAFSYINHKWVEPVPGQPGEHRDAQVPFARHRLAFAGALFADAAITYALQPPREAKGRIGIWDEFVGGTENRVGWLGRPLGPAVRLAAARPDALADGPLARRLAGAVTCAERGTEVTVSAADPAAGETVFTVRDVPVEGSQLTVFATLSGAPRKDYPDAMARLAEVEVAGGATALLERQPACTGMALRRREEAALDAATGARVSFQPNVRIGGTVLPAYAVHPPFKAVKGAVFWCRDVEVPADAELRFSLGLSEKAPLRSDGVWFSVHAATLEGGVAGAREKLFEASAKAHAWQPQAVPLSKWAGRRVRLTFMADCGPADHATADQGYWGDVKLARAGVPDAAITPPASQSTWLNGKPFSAVFFFRDIRSPRVDLTFRVEGAEPVTLHALSAHGAPDARYRLYERGLVLANPGHAPYTFDLAAIAPGRSFRRIRATPLQDTQANSGEPVGATLTLGPLEGLFLAGE